MVQKGEEVEAVITSVDVVNQRISLSMKELLPNEWEEYANAHGVGDLAAGVVTNVTDFGVFVELAPGVEGLCHISEIDRDGGLSLAETFMSSQKVTCRILRIDWNENRIGLSMHSVDQEDGDVLGGVVADAPVVETAMAAALKAGGIVEDEPTIEAETVVEEAPVAEAIEEDDEIVAEDADAEAAPEEEAAAVDETEEAPEAEADEVEDTPAVETAEEEETEVEAAVADEAEEAATENSETETETEEEVQEAVADDEIKE